MTTPPVMKPMAVMDRAHDVLKYEGHPLEPILHPKVVAVIGATEKVGSVGRSLMRNLIAQPFGGTVFPVNPKRGNVLGVKAYPTIGEVPEQVDLAVIITPAVTVPDVISQCAAVGVRGAIVISAGFKEVGEQGVELERQILERAAGKMRVVGPNCLGVMRPVTGLNATFANAMARPGNVAFISQSGALCTAILDWSLKENFGFSAFCSIGSMLDVDWGDLIDYLGDDPHTKSIVLYMESIGDARSFLSAAREVALNKPIILIKAGRTAAAAKAAASHTGALTGSDEVLDAACRRAGVLRVNDIEDLFLMSEVLAKQPKPMGPKLTIITNAGGPGVLATDALIRSGGQLADISPETSAALSKFLPEHWSHSNPIDILGDADPKRYLETLKLAAQDPGSDGLLVILTPQAMTNPTHTAQQLAPCAKIGKPVLTSWMGGAEVEPGRAVLAEVGIPTLPYPDTAARLFSYMWQYTYNLEGLYETPTLAEETGGPDRAAALRIIESVHRDNRTILTEPESKQLLLAYGIPVVETQIATSEDLAVKLAERMGYPVVLKIYSKTITHKTDVGGVQLNLANADAVRKAFRGIHESVSKKVGAEHFAGVTVQPMVKLEAYELILGSSVDAQFGPVLLFGSGGQLVEVYKDRALGLPPLNTTLARRMMEQTQVFKALQGVRGRKAIDLAELEKLLVRFSTLVIEQPWIKEIDINPLLASPQRMLALDARVVLHDKSVSEDKRPRPAIRAYPTQYHKAWTSKAGLKLAIRPIRPEDEPLVVKFHESLSERSVYLRFFNAMKLDTRVAHQRLRRRCFIDYDREMALVVEHQDAKTQERQVLGIGRLSRIPGLPEAEFAVIISDLYQHQGIGTQLLSQLVEVARQEGLQRLSAQILVENTDMQRVAQKCGFKLEPMRDSNVLRAELPLG